MAIVKVFTSIGVKELKCFDNYDLVDFDTGFDEPQVEMLEYHPEEEEL